MRSSAFLVTATALCAALAMACGGGIDILAESVFNYPTLAQCYKSVALDCLQQLS